MANVQEICTDPYLLEMAESLGILQNNAVFLPGREEIKVPVPARFKLGPARKWILKDPRFSGGIRLHHGKANEAWEAGNNVVVTTGTGSGKSLVYIAEAMHQIMSDPHATVIAVYQTQALGADQHGKWREVAAACGLPPETIGIIDGRVLTAERPDVLKQARVLVTTPDSLDAWLLANLDLMVCRNFIRNRRLTIIDEAHLNVGALGSNIMYVLRRLETVQRWLNPDFTPKKHGRYMAASATISDAAQFMKTLTGQEFVEVGEEHNGARIYPKLVVAASRGPHDYTKTILEKYPEKQFLVFMDNRSDVEDFANFFDGKVAPYKSGMSRAFQLRVEEGVKKRTVRGVVSTSSLEVGVDMPFDITMNDGLPRNTARALQRVGRVGRHGPGLFIFTGSWYDLEEYGGDIAQYLSAPLPPLTLYPTNEYIQFAHALRIKREKRQITEALPKLDTSMKGVTWPRGFKDAMKHAYTAPADLPWNLRGVLPPRGNTPHRFNGLRSVGGTAWRLGQWNKVNKSYDDLGSTNTVNAFYEYPPGALVRHQGRRWRVQRWSHDRYGNMVIDMRPLFSGEQDNSTKFRHIKYGQADGRDENTLLGNNVLIDPKTVDESGIWGLFVGEVKFRLQLGLTHFLENYTTKEGFYRTKSVYYHDDEELARLKAEEMGGDFHDYGPRRRFMIDTTGVIIHLPNRLFGKEKRRDIAEALIREYCEAYNFDRSDIAYQETITRFVGPDGYHHDNSNLIIYDRTAGSLRLTQHLVTNMRRLLKRAIARQQEKLDIEVAAYRAKGGSEEYLPASEPLNNLKWFAGHLDKAVRTPKAALIEKMPKRAKMMEEQKTIDLPEGYVKVIPPGVKADWIRNGVAQRVKILEPRLYEGAVVYEVFAVDRFAFFSKARARRFEKHDATGYASEERPVYQQAETRNLDATRFLPASELMLTSGKYVGYNPTTNHYIDISGGEVVEEISAAMEDRVRSLRNKQEMVRNRAKPEAKTKDAANTNKPPAFKAS